VIGLRRIAAIGLIGLTAGCPKTKTSDLELAAARDAIEAARKAKASDCATEIFKSAEAAIAEANRLAETGDHEGARFKAGEAESLANQARGASPPGCEKLKGDEEEADAAASGDTQAGANVSLEDLLETIYFDYNQAHIREDSKAVLSRVADAMTSNPELKIEIEGHCDLRGSTEYNLHLGERRAQAVLKYLVTQGVRSEQIETISYGEERPIDLDETETAHQRNRRAELKKRAAQ